jgi:NAD(P)-dependent dehydrogenase (short-subunit alcohol dehydrogenase family)
MGAEHYLIVGGTTGIGRAMVKRLSGSGHTVSVIGRHPSPEVEQGLAGIHFHAVDLCEEAGTRAAIDRSIKQGGKLSHVVFFQRYRGKGDAWQGELQVSLTATKVIVEHCKGQFAGTGNHAIVIVSSIASRLVLAEQPVSYHMAKAALIQMMRYYAVTLGPSGIRVNAVSPDACVKDEARKFYEENVALRELNNSVIPLGRMGSSEDVVNVIQFVCSSQAAFMTGQEIVVDGGLSIVGHSALARKVGGLDKMKVTR